MTPLPIDSFVPEIVSQLRRSRSLVIVAEPGAGKTTRVAPAILRAGLLGSEHPRIVMLQPRRVAARASAQRIAEENGWELGKEAGYHIRFEKKLGPTTRLAVLTEGILSRQMLGDPFLEGVGAVILDEFHERSLNTDIAIAMLREMQQTVREDLMLIVMSATLASEQVSTFLGGCPVVRVPGRTFPVAVEYQAHAQDQLVERAARAVENLLSTENDETPRGDVLVFLPGAEEIRRVMRRLEGMQTTHDLAVLPLHGSLPAEEQTLALKRSDRRKIILATNIAETSLTIDGVTTVIDSGLARVPWFDPRRGLDRLELKRISKASATQRAGRAGRTGPGRCIRLWSEKEQFALEDFELPEVRRVDLCGAVLDVHAWGKPDARQFGWFESPAEESLASAERLLAMLGALTAAQGGELTELGRKLMRLPVHPRLGRLLIAAAEHGAMREGAALAALLSERDIVVRDPAGPRGPATQGDSDLLVRLDLLAMAESQHFAHHLRSSGIDPIAARQAAKARDDLLRIAKHLGSGVPARAAEHEALLKLLLLAYPDRVCRRRAGDSSAAAIVGGGGVRLAPESVVQRAELFLALDARQDPRNESKEAIVRIASKIEADWLFELFPAEIVRQRSVVYDNQRQRIVGLGRTCYRDLVLVEDRDAAVDPEQAGVVLFQALREKAEAIFQSNEQAAALLARVALLRAAMPEMPWPAFDVSQLEEILADICRGKRSLEEVEKSPLAAAMEAHLPYPLDKTLREEAPESIEVPSGNRIALSYSKGQPPVLAARLQELFGWRDTPHIAQGRVAVVLHLLGPNYRPVQITDDLASFWAGTYFQVRKDLRVRYPKHSWPEDPLSAKAEARGGKRRG